MSRIEIVYFKPTSLWQQTSSPYFVFLPHSSLGALDVALVNWTGLMAFL